MNAIKSTPHMHALVTHRSERIVIYIGRLSKEKYAHAGHNSCYFSLVDMNHNHAHAVILLKTLHFRRTELCIIFKSRHLIFNQSVYNVLGSITLITLGYTCKVVNADFSILRIDENLKINRRVFACIKQTE